VCARCSAVLEVKQSASGAAGPFVNHDQLVATFTGVTVPDLVCGLLAAESADEVQQCQLVVLAVHGWAVWDRPIPFPPSARPWLLAAGVCPVYLKKGTVRPALVAMAARHKFTPPAQRDYAADQRAANEVFTERRRAQVDQSFSHLAIPLSPARRHQRRAATQAAAVEEAAQKGI